MSKGTRITKRWIDADGIMRACYNSFLTTGNKAYSEIISLVEAVPAADVVEVVRCKDCKHSEHWYGDKRRCFLWHEDGIDVFETGYCSYGERKDG